MGYFQGMQNIENDERCFLAMSTPGSESWTLPDYFVSSTMREKRTSSHKGKGVSALLGKGNEALTTGLDQWFVRGRRAGERYLREDGGIGLRRVFWDTNTAIRKEGLLGKATRGNHMLGGQVATGNALVDTLLGAILNAVVSLADVSPSVANHKGGSDNILACKNIGDGMALYAEYEWASAKWFCYGVKRKKVWKHYKCKGNHLALPKYYCGISNIIKEHDDSVWTYENYDDDEKGEIDEEEDKKKEEELRKANGEETGDDTEEDEEEGEEDEDIYVDDDEDPPSAAEIEELAKLEGQSGNIPKEADRILSTWTDVYQLPIDMAGGLFSGKAKSKVGRHLFDLLGIVKIGSGERHDHHGYADWESGKAFSKGNGGTLIAEVVSSLGKQLRMNLRDSEISRSKYRSCAMGVYADAAKEDALWFRGFSRIYGDDGQICTPAVYEGANALPWLLNERFFGPDGTIFVAVAKRRRNPWAQLAGAITASVRNLASIGNPEGTHPTEEGSFMWTVSAGRAAFRDPETGELCGHYKYLNPEGQNDALGAHEPGESGCVCDTAPERLRRQWNLCVTAWEPTLVPVAMADAFRAVEDAGGRGCFVPNPQPETSGLAKVLHWDLDGGEHITTASEEERGWLPLSGTGSEKKEDTFLQVVAPPGTDKDKRFGPKDGADWPKTLWTRKIL